MCNWISIDAEKPEAGKKYMIADARYKYIYPEFAFWAPLGEVFIGWFSKEEQLVTHYRLPPEPPQEEQDG